MKRETMTAERCQSFIQYMLARPNQTATTNQAHANDRCSNHLIQAGIAKGYIEKLAKGKYRWIGPDEASILAGESLFRGYQTYRKQHGPKTNGKTRPVEAGSLKAQMAELSDRMARLETLVADVVREIG